MSLDYLGYIGGMYGTLDGALGFLGAYFSASLFFSTFCSQVFVYKNKEKNEEKDEENLDEKKEDKTQNNNNMAESI